MTRMAILGSVCLVSLACATLPACGQQDETQRILSQCSNPAPDQIDSCIEQVRVQQEADPSPQLKDLIANLLKREVDARNQPQSLQPSLPPDDGSGGAYDTPSTPPPSPDLDSGSAYEPPADLPQDVAPPVQQGEPAATDQNGDDSPPPPPGNSEQGPAPHDGDGPGRA